MNENKAMKYAIMHHKGQKYGNHDYSFHLSMVVKVAKEYNLSEEIVIACWLHDIMEDCNVNYNELKKEFGKEVAEIGYCVTDELGRNRKERKQKTYPKIQKNESALYVKLCDRVANINQSIENKKDGLFFMYKKEQDEFKKNLYNKNQTESLKKLWLKIDKLLSGKL